MPIPRPITLTRISTADWGFPMTDEVNRLTDVIGAQVDLDVLAAQLDSFLNPVWNPLPLSAGYNAGSPAPTYAVFGNWLSLCGSVLNGTGATVSAQVNFATLPVGARPLSARSILTRHGSSHTNNTAMLVVINPSGVMTAYPTSTISIGNGGTLSVMDGALLRLA